MAKESVQQADGDAPAAPVTLTPVPGLPREAAPNGEFANGDAGSLKTLLKFYLHGVRPEGTGRARVWPALLHPFRDIGAIRHEYPLCLPAFAGEEMPRPLMREIDDIIQASGLSGDALERFRRHAYQLEAGIKKRLATGGSNGLFRLAEETATSLLKSSTLGDQRKAQLSADLEAVIEALPADAVLSGCSPTMPEALYRRVAAGFWYQHCAEFRTELQRLVHGVRDMLRADDQHKPEASSADSLKAQLGTAGRQDMDFDRMAELLSSAPHKSRLTDERRERLEEILTLLRGLCQVYGLPGSAKPPFDPDLRVTNVSEAVVQIDTRESVMVEFFRAFRVAQLELDNRYNPAVHDEFFHTFDGSHLSEEERNLYPPVVLELSQAELNSGDAGSLMDLLGSHARLKVILQLNALDEGQYSGMPAWPPRLAGAAMSMGTAFVFQGSAAQPEVLSEAFRAGTGFPGPALFSVYTGSPESMLPAYLDAASATESRALPSYRYDPSLGEEQADRMQLAGNPSEQQIWVTDIFPFMNGSSQESAVELAYTQVDFLFADKSWANHFWVLEPGCVSDAMIPVDEYMDLEDEQRTQHVPYLLSVDERGNIRPVVADHRVIAQAASVARRWRSLQEAAGIDNSHARALLEAEYVRMERELRETMQKMQDEQDDQLGQNLGVLTREIVGRIASQLISGTALPVSAPAPAPARPAPAPVEEAPAAEAEAVAEEEDEDDAPISLDEPYIDTPLCTSCDDCTKMSPGIFAYDGDKQAYIKDASGGSFQELVLAAEKCPVSIIHPGKPKNPDEANLDEWIERAKPFN